MKHTRDTAPMKCEPLERRALLSAAVDGWTALANVAKSRGQQLTNQLTAYQALSLNTDTIANSLSKSPKEDLRFGIGRSANSRLINVPTPDGKYAKFRIVESSILTGSDQKKYGKSIRTFAGVGVTDPAASIRLDFTPLGFHAQVLSATPNGTFYVDPLYVGNNTTYASFYRKNSVRPRQDFNDVDVHTDSATSATLSSASLASAAATAERNSGTQLRTYRAAVATTGEYATFFGGTPTNTLAAVTTSVNRVSGIYETELSIRLTLVSNNSSLIYTNASTDPYTNTNASTLLSQNQTNIDTVIGSANYDIGHVFSTGGGGLAGLGVVGVAGQKARGETGSGSPVGDNFDVDYVAHEMGHQFGGNHTFNTAFDTSNRNASTAYEPGSGSTIMAYAGLEGTDDLQPHSDPYFAWKSLDEILTYVDVTRPTVGTRTNTGNSLPTVTLTTTSYTIPANTPFTLTSPTATDANGDTITYSWEEADLGAATNLDTADNGTSPLFRVYNPTTSPSRTFPRLASVLAGQTYTANSSGAAYKVERLPTTTRATKFVLTLRDSRAGGGGTNVLSTTPVTVNTVAAASTFAITNFNSSSTVPGGSTQTLTWDVAGTTANGINTANVQILMSTDGGQTFPTVLASTTANDGSEAVTLPNVSSTAVRFKVAAVGNIYFDINNANITLSAAVTSATPGVPDLVAASDSGVSNSDNLTNRNNGNSSSTLQFTVGGTVSGATVNILADGNIIGSAVASGTTTTVTTNGTSALTNGAHVITATQTETSKTVSAASAGLTINVDTVAPVVTGTPAFTYLTGGPKVTYTASEAVGSLTLPQFVTVTNTTTSTNVPTANLVTAFSGTSVSVSFNGVSGAPSATTLLNGNYSATLTAGTFTDLAGNLLSTPSTATFFWLNGDVTRNRVVDFNDFLVLQNNFGTGIDYSTGDFNYDGIANFNDFLILQNNFGATV